MKRLIDTSKGLCELLERILFNAGYWVFWLVWNVLGLKWLFRAAIVVMDQADEKDGEKTLRRMKALQRAGEAV
jgi:hypothetical protein